jgi:hypothetical protein
VLVSVFAIVAVVAFFVAVAVVARDDQGEKGREKRVEGEARR